MLLRTRRAINSLGEYRSRLITDVVTGKVNVRAAATGLPSVDAAAVDDDIGDITSAETGSDMEEPHATLKEAEA